MTAALRPELENEVLTPEQLRAYLKLGSASQERTWYRVKPFFAPALHDFDGHHPVYVLEKVRAILAGKSDARSPLSRSRHLRKVG